MTSSIKYKHTSKTRSELPPISKNQQLICLKCNDVYWSVVVNDEPRNKYFCSKECRNVSMGERSWNSKSNEFIAGVRRDKLRTRETFESNYEMSFEDEQKLYRRWLSAYFDDLVDSEFLIERFGVRHVEYCKTLTREQKTDRKARERLSSSSNRGVGPVLSVSYTGTLWRRGWQKMKKAASSTYEPVLNGVMWNNAAPAGGW